MSEVESLSGKKVMIRRTDGRTHPAIIARTENNMVIVEWFENGETKGKEIDIEILLDMNQDLSNLINPRLMPVSHPLSRSSTRSSVIPSSQPRSRPTLNLLSNKAASTNGHMDSKEPSSRILENSSVSNPIYNSASKRETVASVQNNLQDAGKSRKTNTVKEVEKLKHNREVRRQKQAEKKEEKEALMNVDPGNRNWQFLAMIRDYQSQLEFKPLKETDAIENHHITVCVRKRPLNKKELSRKEVDVITIPRRDLLIVHEPKNKVDLTKYLENQQFRFDYAFDESCSNEVVYKFTAKPLVDTVFDGGMATCFAYGQTGSGKTHTMGGTFTGKSQDCKNGIYAMVATDVFQYLSSQKYRSMNFVVTASFFEIYSGKVFDLLNDKAKLRVLEDGKQQVQIVGLTEKVVGSVNEVLALINGGNLARTSGQTSANANSSRSHAVFQIVLRHPGSHKVYGKFSLIDLAGNERGVDTSSADRATRMEGAEINKSLLALKECIRALGRKGRGVHHPFRASKLTQVLRDSFIGENSRTCMIAMISPGMSSCEHSINTLRYADRVKELSVTDPLQDNNGDCSEDNERDGDLAALRSLNQHEISAELYNFHEAVSQLQEMEDDVLDCLRTWCDGNENNREKLMLQMTRDVDYDQEEFATKLMQVVNDRHNSISTLKEKVLAFTQMLRAEEDLSRKMNLKK